MEKVNREKVLVYLLRLGAIAMMLAFVAVIMPSSWMAETHAWLGLGKLPEAPIVDYLARSLSAFYCMHAGLYLVAANDPKRFRPIIVYIAWACLVFGVVMFGVDWAAGMPFYWVVGEGPMIVVLALLMFWLIAGIEKVDDQRVH